MANWHKTKDTDYGCPLKPIFGQTISTHFGTVSPLSMFFIIQLLFLQKSRQAFISTSQIFIWDWDLNLGRKELGSFHKLCLHLCNNIRSGNQIGRSSRLQGASETFSRGKVPLSTN